MMCCYLNVQFQGQRVKFSKIVIRRSQLPRGLRRRSAAVRLLRLWFRIPLEPLMSVCCECCVLSGRGLCDELITHPEESYRLWCVWARSRHLKNEEAMTHVGPQLHKGGKKWRREVHFHVHKSSPLDHIPNEVSKSRLLNPVSLMFILILPPRVSLGVSFPTEGCAVHCHVSVMFVGYTEGSRLLFCRYVCCSSY